MSNGILNRDLVEDGTIVQLDGDGISDGPPLRVMIFGGEGVVLNTSDLSTEIVDPGVGGGGVGATRGLAIGREVGWKEYVLGLRGQLSENERIGDHVVNIVAICAKFVNYNP